MYLSSDDNGSMGLLLISLWWFISTKAARWYNNDKLQTKIQITIITTTINCNLLIYSCIGRCTKVEFLTTFSFQFFSDKLSRFQFLAHCCTHIGSIIIGLSAHVWTGKTISLVFEHVYTQSCQRARMNIFYF